jgi:acyl-CoA hydrolase
MILNIARCPRCGGTSFAVEVKTWVQICGAADHSDEYPHFADAEFDVEDAHYAEPIDGGEIICRNPECNKTFANVAPP